MHPPPPGRFIAIFASRCRFGRPGVATVLLGARILVACALPPLAFAHESHPVDQPAAEEATFLKENDVAMARMMNDMAAKPSGDIDRDFVAMMNRSRGRTRGRRSRIAESN